MKTQMKGSLRFLTLVALFSVPRLASAYYDPGVQRWINRDPMSDRASGLLSFGKVGADYEIPNTGLASALNSSPAKGALSNPFIFNAEDPQNKIDLDGRFWHWVCEILGAFADADGWTTQSYM